MSYDLERIKTMLPEYLHAIGTEVFMKGEGQFTAACPIHGGTKRNFHAKEMSDGTWVWNCRSGCGGVGGTVIDLHADRHGIARSYRDAIKGTAELLGVSDNGESPPSMTAEQRRAIAAITARRQAERVEQETAAKLTEALKSRRMEILGPYLSQSWQADFWHGSPLILDSPAEDDAHLFVRMLFNPDEHLWLGEHYESGEPRHAANFRPAREWLELESLPPRISSGTFKQGSLSRSEANLTSAPFIVIESDDLIGRKPTDDAERAENKRLCAALIVFCQERLKLTLRAVIDTGGKSLHGWFDRPSDEALKALMRITEGLAIDSAVVTRSSNPLRLPGCRHQSTGRKARLHFLNPKTL